MAYSRTMVALAVAAVAFGAGAALADGPQEIRTATTHAGMGSNAPDIKGVTTHMRHVVNCLVGAGGQGFDASAGNPCNGQGGGAIPDTADAATKTKLEAAAAKARDTAKLTDYAAAKAGATDVANMLK